MSVGYPGLQVFDVSQDPAHPKTLATIDTPGYGYDSVVVDQRVYIADAYNGLQVVELSVDVASTDTAIASQHAAGAVYDVFVDDTVAVIADDGLGAKMVDATDPRRPEPLVTVPIVEVTAAVVSDGYLYALTQRPERFVIADVRDPDAARLLGSFEINSLSFGISESIARLVYREPYVYLACGYYGLQIVDVSDKDAPFAIGEYTTFGYITTDVALIDDTAYISSGTMGVRIIDVSDATQPQAVGELDFLESTLGLTAVDDTLYISTTSGLLTFDITNRTSPILLGQDNTPGTGVRVMVRDGTAYVSDTDKGIRVFDVLDPAAPSLLTTIPIPGGAWDFELNGGLGYVACGRSGFRIIDPALCLELAPVADGGVYDGDDVPSGDIQ